MKRAIMIRFTALGEVDLRAKDGAAVGSVLSQPRRLALLAYLAMETTRGAIPRDRLIGVFWPDLPQEQGRQSLRTALHFLRRSLGPDLFGGQGKLISVNPSVLWCDAAAFRSALADGDREAALRLYQGDLLPGFHLEGGPVDFEHWLEDTRAGLRRAAAEAAWSLAQEQHRAGNAAGAGAWARRATSLYQGDEAAARRAIALLGEVGDHAGALEVYRALARRLRDDFDAEPSARTRAAIEALQTEAAGVAQPTSEGEVSAPDAGSLMGAETVDAPSASATEAVPDGARNGPSVRPTISPARRLRKIARAGYSASVTGLLALAFYSLWGADRGGRVAEASGSGAPLIHVEDLHDFSAEQPTGSLAGALTMELTGRLSESKALRVVPATVTGTSSAPAPNRPTYLVRGGVFRADSAFRVTAILVDGASGATLDRIGLERPTGSVDVDEVAETLARRIRRQVGKAVDDHERGTTATNPRALELVRAAVRDMEMGDSLAAGGVTEAARLAFESADSILAMAAQAAPRWPEPSVLRAEAAYRRMWLELLAGDRDGAARQLRVGVEHANSATRVAADDPGALEARGIFYYWLWLTQSSGSERTDLESLRRAETDLRRATTLDAGRARAWNALSAILETRGDFAAANLTAGRAYRADPHLQSASETLLRLFSTSLEVGDPLGARTWCDELDRRLPGSWLPGYCALMQLAWQGPPPGMDEDSLNQVIETTVAFAGRSAEVHARLQMLGAVALARSGSALAQPLMAAARAKGGSDPNVTLLEAWAHLVGGERDSAVALLTSTATQSPRATRAALQSRRFESVLGDPRVQPLLSQGS